jgi:aerobic carbon-monoxide dehydrogenase medium subunit
MYTAPFAYHRPTSLPEARRLFAAHEDASYLSGGHTLIPAMKNRLAAPEALIDLRGIADLQGIALTDGILRIGAATVHAAVAASNIVRGAIPTLAALAGSIGDPQVRNMGTIGGSLANNDPSADYPAAMLGLGATVQTDRRQLAADQFFDGLFATRLEPGEIIVAVEFPVPESCGYAKLCSQASRYAVAAVMVSRQAAGVRVAVTGAGCDGVFRWSEAETALGADFSDKALDGLLPDADLMIEDLNGGADWRANLVAEMTRRAVAHQGRAAIP